MYKNPKYLVDVLTSELNIDFNDIFNKLNSFDVYIKERDIKRFLDNKFYEENPDIKVKTDKLNLDITSDIYDNVSNYGDRFVLFLKFDKYRFEPYTLDYFKNYICILKEKCMIIYKIIEGLIDKTIPKYILENLDINLDENGNILMTDILRLTKPFIYNFQKLSDFTTRANKLETYLDFKLSLDRLCKEDINENELYPSNNLQNEDYLLNGEDGYIPYTEKQKTLIKKREEEALRNMCDLFKNLK